MRFKGNEELEDAPEGRGRPWKGGKDVDLGREGHSWRKIPSHNLLKEGSTAL